jgi:hypothetical protein
MILFHRFLFAIACVLAFMAGAISAGAQEIASQRVMTNMLMHQPIGTLTQIQVAEIVL